MIVELIDKKRTVRADLEERDIKNANSFCKTAIIGNKICDTLNIQIGQYINEASKRVQTILHSLLCAFDSKNHIYVTKRTLHVNINRVETLAVGERNSAAPAGVVTAA